MAWVCRKRRGVVSGSRPPSPVLHPRMGRRVQESNSRTEGCSSRSDTSPRLKPNNATLTHRVSPQGLPDSSRHASGKLGRFTTQIGVGRSREYGCLPTLIWVQAGRDEAAAPANDAWTRSAISTNSHCVLPAGMTESAPPPPSARLHLPVHLPGRRGTLAARRDNGRHRLGTSSGWKQYRHPA